MPFTHWLRDGCIVPPLLKLVLEFSYKISVDNQEQTYSKETTNHCDNSTKSPNKLLMGNNTETCSNNQSIVKSTIYKVNPKENAFTIRNVEIGTGAYVMGNENDRPKIISFTGNIVPKNEEAIVQGN